MVGQKSPGTIGVLQAAHTLGVAPDSTGHHAVREPVFKRILVGLDGSEYSSRACKLAVEMAKRDGSELVIVSIVSVANRPLVDPMVTVGPSPVFTQYSIDLLKAAEGMVDSAVSAARSQGVRVTGEVVEVRGSVVEALIDYSKGEKTDLIIVGTRGIGGFKRLVLGSVSRGVVSHAHCPVMVVR